MRNENAGCTARSRHSLRPLRTPGSARNNFYGGLCALWASAVKPSWFPLSASLSVLLVLALAGCVNLERQYPEKNFFSIEAKRPAEAAPAPVFGDLRLGRLQAAAPYAGKPFVYQLRGLRMEEDFYNRFFAAPGDLITEATARWLRASGLFEQVYAQPAPVAPPWFLEGGVAALYGDFSSAPPQAVLEIGFNLFREVEGRNEIVLSRGYRREVPLADDTPAALAAGWSEALGAILTAFEGDLRSVGAQSGTVREKDP